MITNCFLWCHVRHFNPVKIHPERITQNDKKLVDDLNYDVVGFPVREKQQYLYQCVLLWKEANFSNPDFRSRIWKLDRFVACNWWKKITYLHIKDFDRFMFHKTKNKNKRYFCKSCLLCFSSKIVLKEHKEVCFSTNDA